MQWAEAKAYPLLHALDEAGQQSLSSAFPRVPRQNRSPLISRSRASGDASDARNPNTVALDKSPILERGRSRSCLDEFENVATSSSAGCIASPPDKLLRPLGAVSFVEIPESRQRRSFGALKGRPRYLSESSTDCSGEVGVAPPRERKGHGAVRAQEQDTRRHL